MLLFSYALRMVTANNSSVETTLILSQMGLIGMVSVTTSSFKTLFPIFS